MRKMKKGSAVKRMAKTSGKEPSGTKKKRMAKVPKLPRKNK